MNDSAAPSRASSQAAPPVQRRRLWCLPAGLALAAGLAACQQPGQGGATRGDTVVPSEAVPRISVEQAHAEVQAGRAVLVDVRPRTSYERHRAAGAVALPLDELEQSPATAIRALPVGKLPVLYCT
ncbi:MAG TPA: rhodanese-like domain-containing protein [Chloroflexota bacterium]|nr:rhodanese-like domain-containing protein [Chloroflexota bacterium]